MRWRRRWWPWPLIPASPPAVRLTHDEEHYLIDEGAPLHVVICGEPHPLSPGTLVAVPLTCRYASADGFVMRNRANDRAAPTARTGAFAPSAATGTQDDLQPVDPRRIITASRAQEWT